MQNDRVVEEIEVKMFDLIIIGAGPAGMTAAIYAARRKLNFLILGMDVGGQMAWSAEIENYPGIMSSTGAELANSFQNHMKKYGVKIKQGEVLSITKKKNVCVVKTKKDIYESKAVIIACGKKPKKLNVPGEDKFFGKGVTYCATCDAPLYKGKSIVVAGGANSGMEAALFLTKYAKKVYILEALPKLGGEPYLRDKVAEQGIEVITKASIKEIYGDNFVNGLKYEKAGKIFDIKVEGVFVEIGLISKADFVNVKKNKFGEIVLFRNTKTYEENMTNVPGIYAAGDISNIPVKQIVVAAGEGAKAALSSFHYIDRFDKKYGK